MNVDIRTRRRLGVAMAVDLLRDTVRTRSWALLIIIVVVVVAALAGTATQYALPWAVYTGL